MPDHISFEADRFVWPLKFDEVAAMLEAQAARYFEFAATIGDHEKRNVLIGSMVALSAAQHLIEMALTLQAAEEIGVQLPSATCEAKFLRGNEGAARFTDQFIPHRPAPVFSWARDLRTTALRNGQRTLSALSNPEAVVISTNSLLLDFITRTGACVRFRHGLSLFSDPSNPSPAKQAPTEIMELAHDAAAVLADIDTLKGAWRERLESLLTLEMGHVFSYATRHLARLKAMPLPDVIWSGSGGLPPYRLIGMEIMRRGGQVQRFGHGSAPSLFHKRFKGISAIDLAVSTEYTFQTQSLLDFSEIVNLRDSLLEVFQPRMSAAFGDPKMAMPTTPFPKLASNGALKVLYPPTVYRGARQYLNPKLPDLVYRDWQRRLALMLKKLPIEVTCTLHPRERSRAELYPITRCAAIFRSNFEDEIRSADVVLLDYLNSTNLATSLSSSLPVVFIDIDGMALEPIFERELRRRCAVITAAYDERGRPIIDEAELAEAITTANKDNDPTFFRQLYAGV